MERATLHDLWSAHLEDEFPTVIRDGTLVNIDPVVVDSEIAGLALGVIGGSLALHPGDRAKAVQLSKDALAVSRAAAAAADYFMRLHYIASELATE